MSKKSTTKYTTIIRIIIAALAVSMLVAGPNMALLQQHQGHAAVASPAKQQEQKTIQSLRGNLAKRSAAASQHGDQENQCLRTGDKCGNADLSEQTLGNDNSVTGFTDQSKNVQSRVVITPTPKVTPTPTPTPTLIGTPTTLGTLLISKSCLSPGCTGFRFPITVTGNNPQPSSFSLTDEGVRAVTLGPGSFTVTETPVSGFLIRFVGDCTQNPPGSHMATGTISAGQTLDCGIVNIRSG